MADFILPYPLAQAIADYLVHPYGAVHKLCAALKALTAFEPPAPVPAEMPAS